jgi:hypothetical protein
MALWAEGVILIHSRLWNVGRSHNLQTLQVLVDLVVRSPTPHEVKILEIRHDTSER